MRAFQSTKLAGAGVFLEKPARLFSSQTIDEAVGVAEGQCAKQHRVDRREDRGVGADAEGQRQHSDEREPRRPREEPHGIAEVRKDTFHVYGS